MSRPMPYNRNPALPLTPIPESSQVHYTPPPPPPPAPTLQSSVSSAPSDAMAYPMGYVCGMPEQFWCTPPNGVCAFSTQNGHFPKRQLPQGEQWPLQIMRSDLQHDIQKKAKTIAKQFPALARGITPIDNWYHLYKYWDAVDIWVEGPHFLFYVLQCIGMVNKELDEEQPRVINAFAQEWVAGNEELVVNNPHAKDLTDLFDNFDRGNLVSMRPDEVKYLNGRLDHHRHVLFCRIQEFHRQTAMERGPSGMMGPYPGPMYPPPHHNFPHGPPMIDPRPPVHLLVAPSPKVTTQNYHQFVESQRNLASRFGPRVPPNNIRNENLRPMESRPRGWSNDTARNGRGGRASGNGWNNRNGRANVPATLQSNPPKPMNRVGPAESIYLLTQNPSPQNQRVFSDPISLNPRPQVGQRAFSDSPAGRGTVNQEPPIVATPLGRRASTNDVDSRPNYVPEKIASPPEPRAARSGNSTPRVAAPISNDARVLEAMESQDGCGLLFTVPPERPGPMVNPPPERLGPMFNPPPEQHPYSDIELQESSGGAGVVHTYFYTGPPRKLEIAQQNNHSIFIAASPYELFKNHKLKEFCSQCGEVDNITFLVEKGHAFVAFVDENVVGLAIRRLNGVFFGGFHLTVNRPRARSRGDSYSSQRSYTPNRTAVGPRDPEQGPPFSRRPSFREPYGHVRNFSRSSVDGPHHVRNLSRQSTDSFISPPRIEGRLISSVSEVFQHNAALNRMGPPMPLESIENHYGRNPQNKLNNEYRCGGESPSQTIQYKGKENSPMKSDKPPMTSSRKSSFSSQAGGQGSKRKNNNKRTLVSRQNSSTSAQPHPTGTLTDAAIDSTSAADIKKNSNPTSMISTDSNTQSDACGDVATEKPKQKSKQGNKRKKNASKNKDENTMSAGPSSNSNPSFATESSSDAFEVNSPVGTESSMTFESKSTNTSFSDLPSRKPSAVSSISTPPLSETPEEGDTVSMKAMSPKTSDIDEKSITPKPSQPKLPSSKTPDTVIKQRLASGKAHSKKESPASTANDASSSMRKADVKLAKPDDEVESPEAKINLDDQKEFPALGPVKSPVLSIADGKRPAAHADTLRPPVIGSFSERVVSGSGMNQAKPAVPVVAVPRSYMQRQAPQP